MLEGVRDHQHARRRSDDPLTPKQARRSWCELGSLQVCATVEIAVSTLSNLEGDVLAYALSKQPIRLIQILLLVGLPMLPPKSNTPLKSPPHKRLTRIPIPTFISNVVLHTRSRIYLQFPRVHGPS